MKVHPSSAGDAAAQLGQGAAALASIVPAPSPAAHASAAKAHPHAHKHQTFAAVLAQTSTSAAVTPADTAPRTIAPRAGETLTAVAGHAYSAISGGSRDGMYINTSNNSRRGMAFVLVIKNGREYHIYGSGEHRLVVALRKPADVTPPAPATATPTVSAS